MGTLIESTHVSLGWEIGSHRPGLELADVTRFNNGVFNLCTSQPDDAGAPAARPSECCAERDRRSGAEEEYDAVHGR